MHTVSDPVSPSPFAPKDEGHESWSFTIEGYTIALYKRRYADGSRSDKWYCKFQLRGQKPVQQSTDATTKDRAKEVARLKFLAAWEGRLEALKGSTLTRTEVRLGDILEAYRTGIRAHADHIEQRTIVSNISALRTMIRTTHGDDVAATMEELALTELNRAQVLRYKQEALEAKLEADTENPRTSINSTMAQARSIFSREARELYRDRGLTLPPSLTEWLEVPRFSTRAEDVSYQPIDAKVLAAMDAAVQHEEPAVQAVYAMARWLGMRAGEIAAARWEWLEQWPNEWRMVIRRRDYWKGPKGLRQGTVWVRDEVRALLERCGARDSLHIIGGRNDTDRERVILDKARDFVRRHLTDREGLLHELRKQAGSEVYTTSGLTAAAEFLRNTESVCRRYYATMLRPVAPPQMIKAVA